MFIIKTIPHDEQKYATLGDYWMDPNGDIQVRVSFIGHEIYENAIILHEMTEITLMLARNIPLEESTRFDLEFEANGSPGEPGDDLHCPYYREHQTATLVERQFIHENGLDWKEYERYQEKWLNSHPWRKPPILEA
jgi:hypothetical protein